MQEIKLTENPQSQSNAHSVLKREEAMYKQNKNTLKPKIATKSHTIIIILTEQYV